MESLQEVLLLMKLSRSNGSDNDIYKSDENKRTLEGLIKKGRLSLKNVDYRVNHNGRVSKNLVYNIH